MNDIFRRRLIGLAVLLVLVFILSLLLPKGTRAPGGDGLPSTTVSLDGSTIITKPLPVQTPVSEPKPAGSESTVPSSTTSALESAPPTVSKSVPSIAEPRSPEPRGAASLLPTPKPSPIPPKAVRPPTTPVTPSQTAVKPSSPPVVTAQLPRSEAPKPPVATAPPPVTAIAGPAVKPAELPVSKPAAGTLWYVQMGSFADAGNAQTTVSLLQNIGYRGETAKIVNSAGTTLYRVRLGPFPTEAVARQAFDKVSRQGYPQARVVSEARAH